MHGAEAVGLGAAVVEVVVDADAAAGFAFFQGNEDNAVFAAGAVEGRRVGALEHVEAFDVGGVDVVDGAAPVAPTGDFFLFGRFGEARRVFARHPVDDDERLVIAVDVVVAPDDDARGAAFHAVGLGDVHPGHFTAQGVH